MTYDHIWLADAEQQLGLSASVGMPTLLGINHSTYKTWKNGSARIPFAAICLLRICLEDEDYFRQVQTWAADRLAAVA